ncbi:MAG: two pore domain potassium channel family protein [Betaproteobacteria bacterium]|nr:two pore domain potassium channel family protein [Betaproteobacteria bacterium]
MKRIFVFVANRLWLVLALYVASLCIGAICFSVFENKSLWDGLWWSAVTALTIGYGDLAPATVPGRVTGLILGHFWIFLIIPMIVANIVVHLIEDKDLFSEAEQQEMMSRLKRIEEKMGQSPKA